MAAFTQTQAGNWSSTATWGGTGPPGNGDTASVGFNITVDVPTTVGSSPATGGTAAINVTAPCTVTIAANLTCKGDFQVSAGNLVTVNQNAGTSFKLLPASGQTYAVNNSGDHMYWYCNGTVGSRCTFGTDLSSGGNPGYMHINNRGGLITATYTDFSNFGDATPRGLYDFCFNGFEPAISITNCTFTATWYGIGLADAWDSNWTYQNNQLISGDLFLAFNHPVSSSTRKVDQCIFSALVNFTGATGIVLTNSYFAHGTTNNVTGNLWTSCDGCIFVRDNTNSGELPVPGSLTNCYFYSTDNTSNSFFIMNSSAGLNTQISYCVAEYAGTATLAEPWGETEETPDVLTMTMNYNIVFSSGTGAWLPIALNSNPALSPHQNLTVAEHNTIVTKGLAAFQGAGTTGFLANSVTSVRSNIFVNTGSSTGIYAFNNNSTTLVVDQAPASAFTNNCWLNFATSPSGLWITGGSAPVSGDTAEPEAGTVYHSPMSGTTHPGAGDKAATDPQFVDTSRNLASWGGTAAGGGTATAAAALATIRGNLGLTKSSLLPYVRAGYAPTNMALKAASYGGDTSTADAAGNAWPGGSPGIGAMAVSGIPYEVTAPFPGIPPVLLTL